MLESLHNIGVPGWTYYANSGQGHSLQKLDYNLSMWSPWLPLSLHGILSVACLLHLLSHVHSENTTTSITP
jgi:hypothetical protein